MTMTKTFQILSIQDTPALSWNRSDILFDKKIQEETKKHILYQALNQFALTSFYQLVFWLHVLEILDTPIGTLMAYKSVQAGSLITSL